MYTLSVTFHYDGDSAAEARLEAVRQFLLSLPGIVDVETQVLDSEYFSVSSTWSDVTQAQVALSTPGVNFELADRVGIVLEEPVATELLL